MSDVRRVMYHDDDTCAPYNRTYHCARLPQFYVTVPWCDSDLPACLLHVGEVLAEAFAADSISTIVRPRRTVTAR